MTKYEILTILMSSLALLVSMVCSVWAISVALRTTSAGHRAVQAVKMDTLKLLATIRCIIEKSMVRVATPNVNISHEKKVIQDFMTSSTGFAFYSWISMKSTQANLRGERSEPWRSLFFQLACLLSCDDVRKAARTAVKVESIFEGMTEKDFKKLSSLNRHISVAVAALAETREGNPIIKAIYNSEIKRMKEEGARNEDLYKKLKYLRSIGVNDPNVDAFIAAIEDDVAMLEKAVKSGADLKKMTTDRLLSMYMTQLRDFDGK